MSTENEFEKLSDKITESLNLVCNTVMKYQEEIKTEMKSFNDKINLRVEFLIFGNVSKFFQAIGFFLN